MIRRRTVTSERRQHVARGPLLTSIALALGLGFALTPAAHASTYRVYTANAASSTVLNAGDGFCSLAEAVQHARGNTVYNCTDFAPSSSEQRIELLESANRPHSANHFFIENNPLTLSRQGVPIRIVGSSTGAFIDAKNVYSAFVVPFKSIGYFQNVKLTNVSGSGGGRLIENYGQLGLFTVTIANGDVTGPQHSTGRGGGIFNGNTQGLFPAYIAYAQNSVITGNKARKGGGIYNDSGVINELSVTISNNTATEGGGIYNLSTTPKNTYWTNGTILSIGTKVQNNTARAGGGIFNRGLIELSTGSLITGNSTTAPGTSTETCSGSSSCDGLGGGVLSVRAAGSSDTRFLLEGSSLSSNSASVRGGAVYSAGVLELAGNAMNGNQAPDGAAIYASAPPEGASQYCNFYGNSLVGVATINNNVASAGYSIVSGNNAGLSDFRACSFGGLKSPGQTAYLTAANNSGPNYCRAVALESSSKCPQPCGGLNQACCSSGNACNTNLACLLPEGGGSAYCRAP